MTEIAAGVWCAAIGSGPMTTNVFLVSSGSSWVLIDAGWQASGPPIRAVADSLFGAGNPPASILLTHIHPDHSGAAGELARAWQVPVWVRPDEMPLAAGRYLPEYGNPLDRRVIVPVLRLMSRHRVEAMVARASLEDVARPLDPDAPPPGLPDWRCVGAPGHTPGHAAFFRARDRVLIAGDAVLTVDFNSPRALLPGRPGLWRPPRYTTWNWSLALESVSALARLEPEVIAGGHGYPMAGQGTAARLRALADKAA